MSRKDDTRVSPTKDTAALMTTTAPLPIRRATLRRALALPCRVLLAAAVVAACSAPSSDDADTAARGSGDASRGLMAEPGGSDARVSGDPALADTLAGLIARAYDFDTPGVVERMVGLYAASDSVVSASGGQLSVSIDEIRAGIVRFWEQAGQNMRDARWEWEEVHVERLGDDAAVLTGTWSIPHIAPDGQPHIIAGAWTAAFRRIDGEWKIVHEHLSAAPG